MFKLLVIRIISKRQPKMKFLWLLIILKEVLGMVMMWTTALYLEAYRETLQVNLTKEFSQEPRTESKNYVETD